MTVCKLLYIIMLGLFPIGRLDNNASTTSQDCIIYISSTYLRYAKRNWSNDVFPTRFWAKNRRKWSYYPRKNWQVLKHYYYHKYLETDQGSECYWCWQINISTKHYFLIHYIYTCGKHDWSSIKNSTSVPFYRNLKLYISLVSPSSLPHPGETTT